MSDKVLYSGKTRTTGRKDGASKSADGFLDIKLPEPHPAAENLFGAAWSACYIGALELSAQQKKVKLPESPRVDAEIDLLRGDSGFFLRARFNVQIPGIDRATAEELTELAHQVCPYSKAVHGNIEVQTNVVEAEPVLV
ncbi:Ohr family peroxiredoxin [Terrihabitans soli]|nr:Ohr family peroxiredoxin [Terrihabitans soli]